MRRKKNFLHAGGDAYKISESYGGKYVNQLDFEKFFMSLQR